MGRTAYKYTTSRPVCMSIRSSHYPIIPLSHYMGRGRGIDAAVKAQLGQPHHVDRRQLGYHAWHEF